MTESFSGIRGVWKQDLTENDVIRYALAINDAFSNKNNRTFVIGTDSRESGKQISDLFSNALTSFGFDIFDVGIKPTPVIENAVRHFNADGGLIITASHNPPEYNGWKILERRGNVLYPEKMDELISKAKKLTENSDRTIKGRVLKKSEDAISGYLDFIEKIIFDYGLTESLKNNQTRILFDPNGGAASYLASSILKKCGISGQEINNQFGIFTRAIEPNKNSLAPLAKKMENKEFHFAAGFDCDADRVEFVLPDGQVVSGHQIFAIITNYILSNSNPKSNIVVGNDATSYAVKDICREFDYRWLEVEVGEVNIVKYHDKRSIAVGGEGSSGGIIIPPSRCRDGILSTLFISAALKDADYDFNKLLESIPTYSTVQKNLRIDFSWEEKREKIIKNIKSKDIPFQATGDRNGGLKIFYEEGWIWFRGSRTEEGMIRILADAKEKEHSEKLILLAESLLR